MIPRLVAFALAALLTASAVHASEPPRPLRPELCHAEERPAATSLAIPPRVRDRARRLDLRDRQRIEREARRSTARRLVVLGVAVAAALVTGTFVF